MLNVLLVRSHNPIHPSLHVLASRHCDTEWIETGPSLYRLIIDNPKGRDDSTWTEGILTSASLLPQPSDINTVALPLICKIKIT